MEQIQFASRATFVVGKRGTIEHIQDGAIDPTKATDICADLYQKKSGKSK